MGFEEGFKIRDIVAREVLDSRGNPTIEVDVYTIGGFMGRASVPSGASTGRYEALELRDGDEKRYKGKGVLKAVENVKKIASELKGLDVRLQRMIDSVMIRLDGSENKSRLGANAILGVSIAVAKAAADASGIPLFRYIGGSRSNRLPVPMMNLINGGKHAGNALAIQEFLIMPVGFHSYSESLRAGVEVYKELRGILAGKYGESAVNVGDEGGYAPPMKATDEALEALWKAVEKAGYDPKSQIWLGIDSAASSFYDASKGIYLIDGMELNGGELMDYYGELISKYHIRSVEDPFQEEDFQGFAEFTSKFGDRLQVIGDDLLVTQLKRIEKCLEMGAANALLLKVNQVGSLSEAIDAGVYALDNGWRVIVSHRSGETEDSFIADFAVGLGAHMIKTGAPARGERTAKYNRLIRIEEVLAPYAEFWGPLLPRRV
ncbi:MAG: phosphopyruvate hydratase [Candidatus Bathyarchaeia archaeon]|nr:phosphopyruvate hydratase [Candidatus Bathyarchaeota archaeon]